jgi:hypothetical protein
MPPETPTNPTPPSAPSAPPPPTAAEPGLVVKVFQFLRQNGVIAAGTIIVTILTPFVLVSESTVKRYVEGWLNDCLIVFEVARVNDHRLLVKGYGQGKLPTMLPITFAARRAEINSVHFTNIADSPEADQFTNLAIHPQTNSACPGALCESYGNLPSSVNVTIPLADLSANFVYPFYVDFNGKVEPTNLVVYVQYDPGVKDPICRVERANAFNLFARLSKLGQFALAVAMFICFTVLIAAIRAYVK